MSKREYFSSYKSPNINIVPSASICNPPSPKRPKEEKPVRDKSPQSIDVSFLDDFDVDEIVNCLNDCEDNAQNTVRQQNIENNNDNILEEDCAEGSFEIADNDERNELKYNDVEKDNERIMIAIESTQTNMNTNNTIIKDIKASSNNYNENKHGDVHLEEEDAEIFVPSQITKEPNNKTYNITYNSAPYNLNSSDSIINHMENNNTQEINENIIKNCLLKTQEELSSTNKEPKPFDGDGKTEDKIEYNTNLKIIDKYCKETYLEYSDISELQNKGKTSPILKVESTIVKMNTTETIQNEEFHNTLESSKSFESERIKSIDSSQIINNNENRVEAQKAIDNQQVVLLKNEEPKPEMSLLKNFENFMIQCLDKQYSMISLIHSGQYSKIFKCKDSEDKHYAVKMLKKKGKGYREEVMWNRIQSNIPKENLLCVYLIAGFSLNNHWCYMTDFYPKNLKDVLKESKKNLHIDTIQELAGQLVGAVTTLRNKNIVHSDINPSHILLDCTNRKLRLCGFDGAYRIEAANLFPYKGTECYRAPEVILGYSAGFSLDVWSTALVLHEMATGIQLFGRCIGNHVLYKQICILGDIPPQMLLRSRYRNKYPIEYFFEDSSCLKHARNNMVKGKNKLACTIQGAYFTHWTEGKNQKQINNDMHKIRQFTRLLEQMLVILPEHRLPIEFAYSNPFIYKGLRF